ncbi:ABC transporter permease [Pseudonocardia pini]|uniref:ABC transporter permease n=1 Tax=Pseudonocardia pini TaxID=2758030 RepID=UPI0015F122F1|nr:ABC transporter permease [Pseudonocardia pini]
MSIATHPETVAETGPARRVRTRRRRRLSAKRRLVLSAGSLGLLLACCLFLPTPYSPTDIDASSILQGPSLQHPMGTDRLGRDMLSRWLAAGRLDLPLAMGGAAIALVVGVLTGLLVSVKSVWSERAMRSLDLLQAFPLIILAMVFVSLSGNSLTMIMVAIALIFAPMFVRSVRAEALTLRESRFMEATASIGAGRRRMLLRHMLPGVTAVVIVQIPLVASGALLAVASLSFLGIGVQEPTPSWGAMVDSGSAQMVLGSWWVGIFPGLAIAVCGWLFTEIADGLEGMLVGGRRG